LTGSGSRRIEKSKEEKEKIKEKLINQRSSSETRVPEFSGARFCISCNIFQKS
jgi:hypothetical protein